MVEALKNINEVVQTIVDELQDKGVALPDPSPEDVQIPEGTRISVTV